MMFQEIEEESKEQEEQSDDDIDYWIIPDENKATCTCNKGTHVSEILEKYYCCDRQTA